MKKQVTVYAIIFFCIFLNAKNIFRKDIKNNAMFYSNNVAFMPLVDSIKLIYDCDSESTIWKSYFRKENNYSKLPYCFGGFDTPAEAIVKMEFGGFSGGGFGTDSIYFFSNINDVQIRNYIAGIDCAGFVHRMWDIEKYDSWSNLSNYSVTVLDSSAKTGDWINVVGHQMLQGKEVIRDLTSSTYESTVSTSVSDTPGVSYAPCRNISPEHTVYSIFPILDSIYPDNAEIVPLQKTPLNIKCLIKAKENVQNLRMWLDYEEIAPTVTGKNYTKKVHYSYKNPEEGYHYVQIYAESYTNNNYYCDTLSWYFYYGNDYGKSVKIMDLTREMIPYRGYIFLDRSFNFDFSAYSRMYLSGDAFASTDQWVDDSIEIHVTNEYGFTTKWGYNYSHTGEVVAQPSVDISNLFSPGKNNVRIIMMDDSLWGVNYGCSEIWLSYLECVEEIDCEAKNTRKALKIVHQDKINLDKLEFNGINKDDKILSCEIFDVAGRRIFNREDLNTYKLTMEQGKDIIMSSGVYFYRIKTTNGTISGKLLKY